MTTRRLCTAIIGVGIMLAAGLAHRPAAQVSTVTLTIHMVGLGDPPVTGAVGTSLGHVCNTGADCSYQVAPGTLVKLRGNQPAESTPAAFSGGTGSAGECFTSTCDFVISEDSEITATFDPAAPTLTMTVNLAGPGAGDIGADNNLCQNFDHDLANLPTQFSACQTRYAPNSVVTLHAFLPAGSRFAGFSNGTVNAGVCTAAGSPCSFVLSEATSITATFHTLTSIALSPASDTININQSRHFTANGTYTDLSIEPIPRGLGTWRTRASLQHARYNHGAAVARGQIFAIGGVDVAGPLASVEAYDPASNAWTFAPPMSAPRSGMGVGTIDDRFVYAVGGSTSGACALDTLEMYDADAPASPWSTLEPMPGGARRFLSAAVVGGTLYAIGGESGECFTSSGTALNRVEAYTPGIGWSAKAPMPTARRFFGVGVVDGLIYVVGGDDEVNNLATVEAYNPATDTWSAKQPLPAPRSLDAVAVIDDTLYVLGGNDAGYVNSVFDYDATANSWSNRKFMPSLLVPNPNPVGPAVVEITGNRAELAAASLDGHLYAIGGLKEHGGAPPVPYVVALVDHLIWSSSDSSVAPIDQFGQATGKHAGETTIGARAATLTCHDPGGACATLTVTDAVFNTVPRVQIFGSGASIGVGQTFSRDGSFFDPDPNQTWTAMVNYGDGSGDQALALGPGSQNGPTGTFALSHVYTQAGNYNVVVTVTDSTQASGRAALNVAVGGGGGGGSQIFLGLPNAVTTEVNSDQWGCGSFFDQSASDGPWSAMVDYGDGSGAQSLPLTVPPPASGPCVGSQSSTGIFFFDHAYAAAGQFTVTVTITNTETGISKTGRFVATVEEGACAEVTLSISGSNLPFDTLLLTVTQNGETDGPFEVPVGTNTFGIDPGSYHLVFAVPPGHPDYVVVPAETDFSVACGGKVTVNVQVRRADTTPPSIASVTPSTGVLWPPNHKMVAVTLDPRASDDSGAPPVCMVESIMSSEPMNGHGDGDQSPDWTITGRLSVQLRAERAGGGPGRVYTIMVSCRDQAGNVASKTTQVRVPRDQGK